MVTTSPETVPTQASTGRKRSRLVVVVVLVLLIGFGLFLAGINIYAWWNYRAAQEALEIGDYHRAAACLERSLFGWPTSGEVHFYLARSYRLQGKFDLAEEQLAECRRVGWAPAGIDLEETLLSAQQDDFEKVEGRLIELAKKDTLEVAPVQEALCGLYSYRNRVDAAGYWGERLLKHYPKNVPTLRRMGRLYDIRGNIASSLEFYRQAVEFNPGDDDARESYAATLLKGKEPRKALELYEDLAQRHTSRTVQLGLARCQTALGNLDKSREVLDKLAERCPQDADILSERGRLAQQQGHYADAVKWLRRAVALHPFDHRPFYSLFLSLKQIKADPDEIGRVLAKHDEIRKLEDDLDKLMQAQAPSRPDIYYKIGVVYLRAGDREQSAQFMERAFKALIAKEGNQDARSKLFDQMVQEQIAAAPEQPMPLFAAAMAYKLSLRDDQCLTYLLETVRKYPKFAPAHVELAKYYKAAGDTKLAAKHKRLAEEADRP
jgi:tetratricopeptide (TPR) repeat protein